MLGMLWNLERLLRTRRQGRRRPQEETAAPERLIHQLSSAALQTLTLPAFMQAAAPLLRTYLAASHVYFVRRNKSSEHFRVVYEEDTPSTAVPPLHKAARQAVESQSVRFLHHPQPLLALPLFLPERPWGAILLFYPGDAHPTPKQQQDAAALIKPLSSILTQVERLTEERKQHQLTAALRKAGTVLNLSLDTDTILDNLLDLIAQVLPYDSANVMLLDEGIAHIVRYRGYENFGQEAILYANTANFRLSTLPNMRQIEESKQPLFIPDVTQYEEWVFIPQLSYIQSWVGAPVVSQGKVIAYLCLDKATSNFYQAEHAERLMAFAGQVSLAMQNARLFDKVNHHIQEVHYVADIMRHLNATPDFKRALPMLIASLQDITAADHVIFTLYDPRRNDLYVITPNEPGGNYVPGDRIALADTAVTPSLHIGQPHLTPDLAAETHYRAERKLYNAGLRSRITLPVRRGNTLIGSLTLSWYRQNGYRVEQTSILLQITEAAALAIERGKLIDQAEHRANELATLFRISTTLRVAESADQILPLILSTSIFIIRSAAVGCIILREKNNAHGVLSTFYPETPELVGRPISFQNEIMRRVLTTGEMQITSDDAEIADLLPIHDSEQVNWAPQEWRTAVSIPLATHEKTIGVMHIGLDEKRTPSGEERRLLTAIAEMTGSALNRLAILDTLEQQVAERTHQLAQANERLTELDEVKNKFIEDISHELRTPLTNLSLYLDLLEKSPDGKNHERYLSILRRKTDHLVRLTEAILSISRLNLFKFDSPLTAVDLNQLSQTVVNQYQEHAADAGLALHFTSQPDLPLLQGNPEQIYQMLANLIENALAYTPEGHITLRLDQTEDHIHIRVEDTGIGIAEDDHPYLFDRFYRGQQIGQLNIPGLGLGLAVVKEIVAHHRGEIEADNRSEQGAVFHIQLPKVVESPAAAV